MSLAGHLGQAIILASGALSIWMTQDPSRRMRRWACVVGLVGQPWWIASAWWHDQWGQLLVSLICTLAWLRGVLGLVRSTCRRRAAKMAQEPLFQANLANQAPCQATSAEARSTRPRSAAG